MRFKTIRFILFGLLVILFCFSICLSSSSQYYNNLTSQEINEIKPHLSQPNIDFSKLPVLDYDSIYNEWYHPKIEMLIITPDDQDFIDAVMPLSEQKNKRGVKSIILSNYSLYNGQDNAEKIRNMIKSYYNQENIRWVLLAGDTEDSLIPIRYVYNPDTVEYSGDEYDDYDDYYKPTDFYYADLTGSWDNDGDGKWGESSKYNSQGRDEIDWNPEVYVGRLPASTAQELGIMINKTLNYEKNPKIGDWMNRTLLAGGISDYSPAEDETRLTTHIIQNFLPTEMNYTHLCEYTSSFTPPDPKEDLTQVNFVNRFNMGYSTVFFAGHGNPYRFLRNPSGGVAYTDSNADSCNNINMTSLIYAFACTTAPIDQNDDNIGEILIKKECSGAIGYIGGLRITWYFDSDTNLEKLNRGNAKLFWKELFEEKKFQQGKALYDSKVTYMNSDYFDDPSVSMKLEYERKNVLTYCLLGDPELDIYTSQPQPAQDPFTSDIYEGQHKLITIKDVKDNIIPYARVHLETDDGQYFTFYADKDGICDMYTPAHKNQTYHVNVTGHNLILTRFNFTTLSDEIEPLISNLQMEPPKSLETGYVNFNVSSDDSQSGLESVFLLTSKNNFTNYRVYSMNANPEVSNDFYELQLKGLSPGEYKYLAIARDFANNTKMLYNKNFVFQVLVDPNKNANDEDDDNNDNGENEIEGLIITIVTVSLIVGLMAIFVPIGYKLYKKKIEKDRLWEITVAKIRKREMRGQIKSKKGWLKRRGKRKRRRYNN